MKKLLLLFIATAFLCSFILPDAQKEGKLVIKFKTKGTIEGYDHETKMMVYVDDVKVGESSAQKQTIPNSVEVKVPRGKHHLKCVMYAKYEGNWEERTLDNNYSFDWKYEESINFKKKNKLKILFDIDNNAVTKE